MSFTLKNAKTKTDWNLDKEAAGRPVMLTFWTSWCPDSNRDLAEKIPLYQYGDPSKLCFMTINVTGREGNIDPLAYLAKQGFHYPVLLDDGTKIYDAYGCAGVPTTVLLNKSLEVVEVYGDQARLPEIMAGLAALIE